MEQRTNTVLNTFSQTAALAPDNTHIPLTAHRLTDGDTPEVSPVGVHPEDAPSNVKQPHGVVERHAGAFVNSADLFPISTHPLYDLNLSDSLTVPPPDAGILPTEDFAIPGVEVSDVGVDVDALDIPDKFDLLVAHLARPAEMGTEQREGGEDELVQGHSHSAETGYEYAPQPVQDTEPAGNASTSNADTNGNTEVDDANSSGVGICREYVDVMSLPVIDNPLQKDGRHTVVRGRLADGHPYLMSAMNLGRKMVSRRYRGMRETDCEEERKKNFLLDLETFHSEIHTGGAKLPIIGGGNLDLYTLTKEVLLLGGVLNVVEKRAFRIVSQQLQLPPSCTSAAYVLKCGYERMLYYYEDMLTNDTWPDSPQLKVNLKAILGEKKALKERQKRERQGRGGVSTGGKRKRRRSGEQAHSSASGQATPPATASNVKRGPVAKRRRTSDISDPDVLRMLSTMNATPTTHYYLKMVANDGFFDGFSLPQWARMVPGEDSYLAVLDEIQRKDLQGQGKFSLSPSLPFPYSLPPQSGPSQRPRYDWGDFLRMGIIYVV